MLPAGEGGECNFLIKSILDEMRIKGELYSVVVKAKLMALRSGFQTTSTFIRNFKRIVGVVPKDWRRMAKSGVDNPVNYNVSVLKGW